MHSTALATAPPNIGADTSAPHHHRCGGYYAVRNPLPARGGAAPESLDEVKPARRRLSPPGAGCHFGRLRRCHRTPSGRTTRCGNPSLDWKLAHDVCHCRSPIRSAGRCCLLRSGIGCRDHIEPFRLAGHDVEVDAPRFVAWISA